MKIFVLTTGRSERIDLMSKQLESKAFEFIYATETPKCRIDKALEQQCNILMSVAERNVIWTHYRAWQKCISLAEPILIFEDNALINYQLWNDLDRLQNDIVYLGALSLDDAKQRHINSNINVTINHNHYTQLFKGLFYTRGYMITPKVAFDLIQCNQKFSMPVDQFFNQCWVHGNRVYRTTQCYVTRSTLESTIGNKASNRRDESLSVIGYFRFFYAKIRRSLKKICYRLLFKTKSNH